MATPDFDNLCDILVNSRTVDANPAELHGLACGILAAGFQPGPTQWLQQIADYTDQPNPESMADSQQQELLISLLTDSYDMLASGDFEFQLCLPDDDLYGIAERSNSLARWCQGFLHGFAAVQNPLSEESNELLGDLTEISRLEINEEEDETQQAQDENEGYYAELTEFVRMAVIGLFMDYSRTQNTTAGNEQHVHH